MSLLALLMASTGQTPITPSGDVIVWLEGQSNVYGVGSVADLAVPPINADTFPFTAVMDRVWTYNPATSTLEKMNVPENSQGYTGSGPAGGFGPELGIGQRWMEETTEGNLIIFKNFVDGGAISQFQKPSGYYTGLQTMYADMQSEFAANGLNPTSDVFVWGQGEGDNAQTQIYYHDMLEQTVDDRISDGMLSADCLRVITCSTSPVVNQVTVNAAKVQYASEVDGVTTDYPLPDSVYYNTDDIHLNAKGQLQMAYDIAELAFGFPAKNVNV